MKKLLLILLLPAYCYSADIFEKQAPPAYTDSFVDALEGRDVKRMLAFAETSAANYLEKWAMASAATAFEGDDNGQASFWLARRLVPHTTHSVDAPELEAKIDIRHTLGKRYLLRAIHQGHPDAPQMYRQSYHQSHPATTQDETNAIFREAIELAPQSDALIFKKHADHYISQRDLLRALAMTFISEHYPQKNLALSGASTFANHRIPVSAGNHSGFSYIFDDSFKLFTPNIALALKYLPISNINQNNQVEWILWSAEMCKNSGNVPEARRLYEIALKKIEHTGFRNLGWHIKEYLEKTAPVKPKPAQVQANNECVIL